MSLSASIFGLLIIPGEEVGRFVEMKQVAETLAVKRNSNMRQQSDFYAGLH